ncbi:MAG: PEGA domain-containing protein [Acidimicrobiia bacterium]
MKNPLTARRMCWCVALSVAIGSVAVPPSSHAGAGAQQLVAVATAEARNGRVEPGAGTVTIHYDLVSADPKASFTVRLEAALLPGDAYDLAPLSTRGDVGQGVQPGIQKRIVWEAAKDVEEVQLERFKFRIVASPPAAGEAAPAVAGRTTLTVVTSPDGAMISLDGRPLGLAPLEIRNVSAGQHRLTASKVGFGDASRLLTVVAGQPLRVDVPLTAVSAESQSASKGSSGLKWIAIGGGGAAAAGAAVALGGGNSGSTPPSSQTTTPTSTNTTPPTATTPNRAPTVSCGNILYAGTTRAMAASDVAIVSATRLQFIVAAASDVDGDSLSFTVTYGNGVTTTSTYSTTNNSTTYIYPGASVYSPSVTVRDARGGEAGCRFPTVTTSTVAGEWIGPATTGRLGSRFQLSQSALTITGNYFENERTAGSAITGTMSTNVEGRKDGSLSLTVGGNYSGQLTFQLEPSDDLRTYRGTFTYRGVTSTYEMRK